MLSCCVAGAGAEREAAARATARFIIVDSKLGCCCDLPHSKRRHSKR
jgi:hypothetical protein